jgi:hypothetical protein
MNRFADGAKHQQALPGGQAPTVAVRVDWLSLDVFHDQKVDGVVVADIVEEANPRMVESRNGLRLSGEPLSQVAALGESVCPHLDCDTPIQSRVPCAIDIAHSARAYPVAHLVRPDAPTLEIASHSATVRLCGVFEKSARPKRRLNQRFDLLAQFGVVETGFGKEGVSVQRRQING